VKKGVTEGAVEMAVSQGMANGAKKKPVGKRRLRMRRKRRRLEVLGSLSLLTYRLFQRSIVGDTANADNGLYKLT
jgi:hypothetical protein